MGDRTWRPWHGTPYEPDAGERLAALYLWTDAGAVFVSIGPIGSIQALGDRYHEHCIGIPQVVPAERYAQPPQCNDVRRAVVTEALAIAEGRAPRPYSERHAA